LRNPEENAAMAAATVLSAFLLRFALRSSAAEPPHHRRYAGQRCEPGYRIEGGGGMDTPEVMKSGPAEVEEIGLSRKFL
jgi:hypothetical protein